MSCVLTLLSDVQPRTEYIACQSSSKSGLTMAPKSRRQPLHTLTHPQNWFILQKNDPEIKSTLQIKKLRYWTRRLDG